MKKRKLPFLIFNLVLCFALLFCQYAGAVTFAFETQSDYEKADISWLTDLVIKESMDSAAGLTEKTTLKATPENPYSTTASAFKQEVARYCEIYTLTENAPRAGYIYLFEFLNSNSGFFSGQVSDETVVNYLENVGVQMPESMDTDDYVLARALYSAMITGAFNGLSSEELGKGVAFEKALLRYLLSFSGSSEEELYSWLPEGEDTSFDDYVLASSKYALRKFGLDVTPETSESETYRLMAVMTLQKLQISVDTNSSIDELKAKYTAVLLGRKYGVSVEADRLTAARADGTEGFYMLQLIGKKAGLSVKNDMSYEDAFNLVAKNSSAFDIEEGEWYADIYQYEATLKAQRDTIWIYPVSYLTGQEDAQITITVNGTPIQNGAFSAVKLTTAKEQILEILVRASNGLESRSCRYYITVKQGPAAGSPGTGTAQPQSSGSIISNILSTLGMDPSVSSLVDSIYDSLPVNVKNVISFIAPTFDDAAAGQDAAGETPAGETAAAAGETQTTAPAASANLQNSYFVSMLDKLGAVIDYVIYGVDGVDLSSRFESRSVGYNFITFN